MVPGTCQHHCGKGHPAPTPWAALVSSGLFLASSPQTRSLCEMQKPQAGPKEGDPETQHWRQHPGCTGQASPWKKQPGRLVLAGTAGRRL